MSFTTSGLQHCLQHLFTGVFHASWPSLAKSHRIIIKDTAMNEGTLKYVSAACCLDMLEMAPTSTIHPPAN